MIIDTHTHVFPREVKENRSSFFDNEPEFKLLYNHKNAQICVTEELISTMNQQKVDLSVITGFPWRDSCLAIKNNDMIIESVQKYPDRIKGLACFDVNWDGAAKEAKRCIDEGLSGVGELAFYLSGIDDTALSRLAPVMDVLRSNGNLPCMIHTNEPVGHLYPGKTSITLEQIYALAKKFAENKIILAHWGGGIFFYNTMKKEVKEVLNNIWYDTAASVFLYGPKIYDMAKTAGVIDKILFGTDYPLLAPKRYYDDLNQSDLNQKEKDMVLGLNAAMFYG
ncbi:MAG: amidohydrolase family protein [Desulfobacteraceae bacterium]|nr:amidohydrolase family protein [Desulfobacteraceae bacterium]